MKKILFIITLFILALILAGCNIVSFNNDVKMINPSDTIISDNRTVSEFNGIDFRTFGKVVLTQGETESVVIKGSDNVVPVIQTSVRNGVLVIQTDEDINITGMNKENVLTFTIVVKDLTSLTISGAAEVDLARLSTSKLDLTMSGVGNVQLGDLQAESMNVTVSGAGSVNLAGEVSKAWINISGAGPVNAADLKIGTADVTISGIGSASVWVIEKLTGNISGAGNVSYYGDPMVSTTTSGIGEFKSLGSK